MEKKYQIMYIWSFIIISGIILLLLYTPMGGKLHYAAYSEQDRYSVAPGVNYSSQVSGFSGGSSTGGTYNYSVPTQSAYTSPSYSASGGGYATSTNYGSASYGGAGGGITLTTKAISSSGGGGGGGAGFGAMAGGGGRSSNQVSNTFTGGGSMGGNLFNNTMIADGGVMQKGTNDEDDPLDAGGDPTGTELPLDNELVILLILSAIFALYKWLIVSKK